MSILDTLPKVIRREVSQDDVKAVDPADEKPFILCLMRDLEPEELDLLKSYGKVFVFHHSFVNIPISKHDFLYAVYDMRDKIHRDSLMKEDLSPYHIVAIVGLLDRHDDTHKDVNAENLIRSFPQRQAFASSFNRLLLSKKIRQPSILKAILRFFCSLSSGYLNE